MGNLQKETGLGIFPPTANPVKAKMLLALATVENLTISQADISNAFVNAKLPPKVYVSLPKEMGGGSYRLNRALYGLRESPREWSDEVGGYLMNELNYTRSKYDPCYFWKELPNGRLLRILLYVDDFIFVGEEDDVLKERDIVLEKYKGRKIEPLVENGTEFFNFLGIEISRNRKNRETRMSQPKMVERVLDRFRMAECKKAITPMVDPITRPRQKKSGGGTKKGKNKRK